MPQPFNNFDLLDSKVAVLAKARFGTPTEIQSATFPIAMSGQDLLAIAPTGFGKMEAAFLPLLSKVLARTNSGEKAGVMAIYITPLKSLNRDMLERMQRWCRVLNVSLAVRHGDTTPNERVKQRDNPPQIMVTTPESLGAMLVAPKLGDSLANVRIVVIDEVHELVDSKRGSQLSLLIERLRARCGTLQVIGLSATVGDEETVARFVSSKATVARVDLPRNVSLSVDYPRGEARSVSKLWKVDAETAGRIGRIVKAIEESSGTLVFVNTRSLAESLSSMLLQMSEVKEIVGVHHGSLSKETRMQTEEDFKSGGKLKAIICTSSLELGIDIGTVEKVVQYHSPRQVTRLLQRVGRSGHGRNRTPEGIILPIGGLDVPESAVICKRSRLRQLERPRLFKHPLDVLAAQIVGIALDNAEKPVSAQAAFALCKKAPCYTELTASDFAATCRQLADERLLEIMPDGRLAQTRASRIYYYENLSTIRDSRKYFMKSSETRRNVAMLDERFVSEYVTEGGTFIARGVPWKVLAVTDDEIVVEQSNDYTAAIPDWIGEEIPVSMETAQDVADLLAISVGGSVPKDYCCEPAAEKAIVELARKQSGHFTPKRGEWVIEENGSTIVIHTFAGTMANETISRILASLLTASGIPVRTRASAYAIGIEAGKKTDAEKIRTLLGELTPANVEGILMQVLPTTAMFRYRFIDVSKRFGFIRRDADLKDVAIKRIVDSQKGGPIWREAMAETMTEKLDLDAAKTMAAHINSRRISIGVLHRPNLSPLAREFLEFYAARELVGPAEPTDHLLEAFKRNLLEERTDLQCNYCRHAFTRKNGEVAGKTISCPSCGSSQLTLGEYSDVVNKPSGKLTPAERKRLGEARRVEAIIASYGGNALVAFSTYGVGPESASRVLSRLRKTENEFYIDLLEAQKNFIKTRQFWRI